MSRVCLFLHLFLQFVPNCTILSIYHMMALPSCRLSSAINYTLLSLQERCSLSPCCTHSQTQTQTHTADTEGTDTCGVFVTSSVDICGGASLWEKRPSGTGEDGLEGGKWVRCITLLFSVGLTEMCEVLCCSTVFVQSVLNCIYNKNVHIL
ncbi:hypothetical protein ILYODFUR_000635 [Ilyodon furcidens]|uniref:Secreted protein n=1 Tax=Ilyodon furcidens TaxID=33524 RepID=A0ABV0VAX0_9TELE